MSKTDRQTGHRHGVALGLFAMLVLGGCGLKDDLYIPAPEEDTATAAPETDSPEPDPEAEPDRDRNEPAAAPVP
jgi:predicted small lipoprotein YifL